MKSLVLLWSTLARDLASACHTSTERDIKTVTSRVEHEGVSFLTITLPNFGKAFDSALQQGWLETTAFRKARSGLPAFLQGYLLQVFDKDGFLRLTDASVDAVDAIRQLCYVFQKIELDCSEKRKRAAVEAFVIADVETGIWDDQDHSGILSDMSRIAQLLFRETFSKMDEIVYYGNIVPRHGPGGTADRLVGNAKYDLTYWPARLEAHFPYSEYGIPSPRFDLFCQTGRVQQPEMEEELPARVVLVPKTLKTPRVISAEPTAMQWIQQGIAGPLCSLLESDEVTGPMIGFTDQLPNREMAQDGSIFGRLATLDLKEASDRVSFNQVASIFPSWPKLFSAMTACRSNLVKLPDEYGGNTFTLRKFAPMGSALCFPLEACVFLTAVFVGIECYLLEQGKRDLLSRGDISRFHGSVRVYGDDIIVPVEYVEKITEVFDHLGWKINSEKSFVKGNFRESCGGDYFWGEDVTPVKLRRVPPKSFRKIEQFESFIAFRNALYLKGRWETCKVIDEWIKSMAPYPLVSANSPILGRLSLLPHENFLMSGDRWEHDLQHIVRRGIMAINPIPKSSVSGVGALLKCLLVTSEQIDHLERAGRPVARKAKPRRGRPF